MYSMLFIDKCLVHSAGVNCLWY